MAGQRQDTIAKYGAQAANLRISTGADNLPRRISRRRATSELIPLCHPLALNQVEIEFHTLSETELAIRCTCKVSGRTGVEIDALTGSSIAALTVYDMCKAIDRGMTVAATRLVRKEGGKSGTWVVDEEAGPA